MQHLEAPRLALRASSEDQTNLAMVADAVRTSSQTSFVTMSQAIRAALRAAAILARRGELDAVLARYRADLAGG